MNKEPLEWKLKVPVVELAFYHFVIVEKKWSKSVVKQLREWILVSSCFLTCQKIIILRSFAHNFMKY